MEEAIMMPKDGYTVDDLKNLPEGRQVELIDGEIFDMAGASPTHQICVVRLISSIDQYINGQKGTCQVFTAPVDVFLDSKITGKHCYQPDVFVVCDKDKIKDDGIHGAPDWVIEILSPSTAMKDRYLKTYYYGLYGVKEYWIVDLKSKKVKVYQFPYDSEADGISYSFDDIISPSLYPDLKIKFSDLLP